VGIPIPALIVITAVALIFVAAGTVSLFKPRSVIRFTARNYPYMNMTTQSGDDGCLVLQARIMGVVFVCGGLFLLLIVATALSKSR
jgi:hypothetical protein